MNVLPLYIDDWLSSQAIDDMDAEEERGYFRLCLHAAKLELEGLPKDERLLSNWSRLGAQWNKPTKDKRFRSELTSGQKILRNFFEQDGRLFNQKVLVCVQQYKTRQDQAQQAAQKRWQGRDASAMREHMREQSGGNATRVGSENGHEQTLSPGDGAEGGRVVWDGQQCGWQQLIEAAASARMAFDPNPDSVAAGLWVRLAIEEKLTAIRGIYERMGCGQYEDPQFVPTLENYIRGKKWRESLRPRSRAGPQLVDKKKAASDEAMRRILKEREDAEGRKIYA